MSLRVTVVSMVNPFCGESAAKASLNRATEYDGLDPNPGDLGMARLKVQ